MSDQAKCFNCGTTRYPGLIFKLGALEVCRACLESLFRTGELSLVYDEKLVPKPVPEVGTKFNPSER